MECPMTVSVTAGLVHGTTVLTYTYANMEGIPLLYNGEMKGHSMYIYIPTCTLSVVLKVVCSNNRPAVPSSVSVQTYQQCYGPASPGAVLPLIACVGMHYFLPA